MAVRNTPKLADLLRKFEEARQKTAGEIVVAPEDVLAPQAAVTPTAAVPSAPAVEAVPAVSTAEEVAAAAQQVKEASSQVVDAKETLKAVTDEFINEHTAALKKEAQIFGELFAASCMEQMNKTAALQQIEQNAYAVTVDAFTGADDEADIMQKTAAVYDEAYFTTLAKFAGLDSPEELQAAMAESPETLPPEVVNAVMGASGGMPDESMEEDLEEPNEEEVDKSDAPTAVADTLAEAAHAASTNAAAIKSIAEAADALTAEGDYAEDAAEDAGGEGAEAAAAAEALGLPTEAAIADSYVDEQGNVDLPKIASQAYDNVMAYMANGVR